MGRKEWAGARALPRVSIEDGKTLLRVDGVIQSVAVDDHYEPDFWDAMIPETCPGCALILGMGGGTVASLLSRRFAGVPVLGIERDARVAMLARERFGLDQFSQVQVLEADAFDFVEYCTAAFDLICVDLYVAGRMEHGVLSAAFLRQVARLLTPDGVAVFNLWRSAYLADQLRRLGRILDIVDAREIGQNVVVRCMARPLVRIMSSGERRATTAGASTSRAH